MVSASRVVSRDLGTFQRSRSWRWRKAGGIIKGHAGSAEVEGLGKD
jgi:hypothetical protein